MKVWALALGGALLFGVAATANAGGYRYGVSDQAFYIPAIAMTADASLFPRDAEFYRPQLRMWIGRHVFAAVARWSGSDVPAIFGWAYVAGLVLLFGAALAFGRAMGFGWWAVIAFLALLTLRHEIAKTGANSLEGYMHPRMLAFAAGLASFAWVVTGRRVAAVVAVAVAAAIHPTTALWFGGVVAIAILLAIDGRAAKIGVGAALVAVLAAGVLFVRPSLAIIDPAWRAALGDRAYLFPSEWPVSAWVLNLAYPLVLVAIYRRRRLAGVARPHEGDLVSGLLVLVAGFLASVPFSTFGVASVVQLQVPRVFWLVDVVVAAYVAWWLVEDVAAHRGRRVRVGLVAALMLLSAARGTYVLAFERHRPLASPRLQANEWTDVMTWLRAQPLSWHVLADPGHASKFGTSVRVAALRDTLFEGGKDPAMALYDRNAAMRVAERALALADPLTTDRVRALDDRFGLDVFIADAAEPIDRPVLYRNGRFVAYDLR